MQQHVLENIQKAAEKTRQKLSKKGKKLDLKPKEVVYVRHHSDAENFKTPEEKRIKYRWRAEVVEVTGDSRVKVKYLTNGPQGASPGSCATFLPRDVTRAPVSPPVHGIGMQLTPDINRISPSIFSQENFLIETEDDFLVALAPNPTQNNGPELDDFSDLVLDDDSDDEG
jgi:hypothetical protein